MLDENDLQMLDGLIEKKVTAAVKEIFEPLLPHMSPEVATGIIKHLKEKGLEDAKCHTRIMEDYFDTVEKEGEEAAKRKMDFVRSYLEADKTVQQAIKLILENPDGAPKWFLDRINQIEQKPVTKEEVKKAIEEMQKARSLDEITSNAAKKAKKSKNKREKTAEKELR